MMRTRPRSAQTKRREPTVVAALGLSVEHGGHRGEIVELRDTEVVLLVGAARVRVKYGSDVTVEGRTVSLAEPLSDVGPPLAHGGSREAAPRLAGRDSPSGEGAGVRDHER